MSGAPCDLLCLGAGFEQLGPISIARSMGLRVLALDRDPCAPGLLLADETLSLDPSDVESTMRAARHHCIRGLLPVPMGRLLAVAGEVNSALGLRGVSKHAALLSTDKLLMRRALGAAGCEQPRSALLPSGENFAAFAERVTWPAVVKPRHGSGSRAVCLLSCARDFIEFYGHAEAGEDTLIEDAVSGTEYGVDGVVVGSDVSILCIREKEMSPPPDRLGTGYISSPCIQDRCLGEFSKVLAKAADALGFRDTLWHADVMVSKEYAEPIVIEMSARPSGYLISERFVQALSGVPVTRQAISMLLGNRSRFEALFFRHGALRLLKVPRGADFFDAAKKLPGVVDIVLGLSIPQASCAKPISADAGFQTVIEILAADTAEEVTRAHEQILKLIAGCG